MALLLAILALINCWNYRSENFKSYLSKYHYEEFEQATGWIPETTFISNQTLEKILTVLKSGLSRCWCCLPHFEFKANNEKKRKSFEIKRGRIWTQDQSNPNLRTRVVVCTCWFVLHTLTWLGSAYVIYWFCLSSALGGLGFFIRRSYFNENRKPNWGVEVICILEANPGYSDHCDRW